MQWFRMHTEARTDRKLDTLTDAEHRVWFGLLCMAGEGPERGTVAFESIDLLALEVAKGDSELLGHALSRLVTLRIVTARDNEIEFLNWDKRQYDKPSDTPEETRRRKAEERQRKANSEDVTPRHTPSRPITDTENKQNRTDTEDLSSERSRAPERPSPAMQVSKPSPKAATRSCRFPDTWAPSRAVVLVAQELHFDELAMRTELDKFASHFRANGKTMVDWDQAAMNWLRRSLDFPRAGPVATSRNGQPKGPDFAARAIERRRLEQTGT